MAVDAQISERKENFRLLFRVVFVSFLRYFFGYGFLCADSKLVDRFQGILFYVF